MPIQLGRDCTITGVDNFAVRNVVWSSSAKEYEFQPFGLRPVYRFNCGYDATVDIDLVMDDGGPQAALQSGENIAISGSGYSGEWIVTNVVRSEPLDDVVSLRVTAKLAYPVSA
jgi:hypothetical protein